MHSHAGGLIYDSHIRILKKDVEGDVFGKCPERGQRHRAGYGDLLSSTQLEGGFGRFSVYQNLALLDHLLHTHPAYVRKLRDEPLIKALAGGIERDDQTLDGDVMH
jgi:hypothetical protein